MDNTFNAYVSELIIKNWVELQKPKHFFVNLPTTFEDYLKSIDKVTRTDYNKSIRLEYKFDLLNILTEKDHKDIIEVLKSKNRRQNREMNFYSELLDGKKINFLQLNKWIIDDYTCSDKAKLFVVRSKENNIVAYLELLYSNNDCIVHYVMGHGDHLKNGVMKHLFLDAIKYNFPLIKRLFYGIIPHINFFLKDLRIINKL